MPMFVSVNHLRYNFVVNVHHNGVPVGFDAEHRVGEDITAHRLRHVFGQFPPVRMGFLPLSSLPVDAHIVDLFFFLPPRGHDRLEFWVGVRQHPTGGKFTEEELSLIHI